MGKLQFEPMEYFGYLLLSSNSHLLVEGDDDCTFFSRLFDKFENGNTIDIDDASQLIGFGQKLGNREKVEFICQEIDKRPFKKKLVGFVDRESRGFIFEPQLFDQLSNHKIVGQLVWSRGHSIENYFFDIDVVREPIDTLSTAQFTKQALLKFEEMFNELLRLACIIGLLGKDIGNYKILKSILTWEMIIIINGKMVIDKAHVIRELRSKNFHEEIISKIDSRYDHWYEIVNNTDNETVRWLCHGHTGLSILWAGFKRIVYEVSVLNGAENPMKEVTHAIEVGEKIRCNACAMQWKKQPVVNSDQYPFELLRMLGLIKNSLSD